MYSTGASMDEKASKEQQVTATERQKNSPQHQKSICDSRRRTYAYPKALSRSASNAASIDVSDRQEIWSEGIEWTKSDGNRVTKYTYLSSKNRITTQAPDLRRSKAIVFIHIECGIDWCMIHVKQWVRTCRKQKKWRHQTRQNYSPQHQKSNFSTSRRIYANPNPLSRSASNVASIDVSGRREIGLEEVEWTKSDGTRV